MGTCKCGFSTDPEKNCNGTHNVVKEVREHIAQQIESIEIEPGMTNALGMRMMAANIARGKK
jgi:hypothetical protein